MRAKSRGSVRVIGALIAVGALAAGGAGVWLFNGDDSRAKAAPDTPRFNVVRGTLRVTLRQTGTFEAEDSLPVRADIRGSSKIVWLIDEGTSVKKGQVVVELDKADVEKDVDQFTGAVDKTRASLVAAQADEEIAKLDCESKIRKGEMDGRMAELEIKKFNEQVKKKEVRDLEIKRDTARVKLSRLGAIDERMPKMLEQGFVTKEERADSQMDVRTAQNELDTSEIELKILNEYTHPMQLERLVAERDRLKYEIDRFWKEFRRREAQTKAATTQAQQEFDRASRQLKDAKEELENMTVHAPSQGIVVYGGGLRNQWNQEDIKVGVTAHRHLILMRLPNLNTMQVVLQIHEADVNKVRVNEKEPQAAAITTESMPGRTFDGFVKKVDTIAQGNWFNRNVKWFATTIGLKKQITGIRPGMTAAVEILVEEVPSVLYVPIQSVHTRRGQSFCYVPLGGTGMEKRPVTIGASNNAFVQIKDGVKEGEEVLLVKPELESSDASGEDSGPKAPYQRPRGGSG